MKKFYTLFFLIMIIKLNAQSQHFPMQTVTMFFDAFHAKDSLGMQAAFHSKARLLRSGVKENQPIVVENNLEKFIRAVATRPATPTWEERLGEPIVQQNQNLATVWVPFRFYLNDQLSHCGYNLFTLTWDGLSWLILTLIDTSTEACH